MLNTFGYEISNSSLAMDAWRWYVGCCIIIIQMSLIYFRFVSPANGGLDCIVEFARREGDVKVISPIIEQFCKKHYNELFTTHLRSVLPKSSEYLAFIHELLVPAMMNGCNIFIIIVVFAGG